MKNIIYSLWFILPCLLSSCVPKGTQWTPGEPDNKFADGVWFDSGLDNVMILSVDEAKAVKIQVHRERTALAADIPIIGSCNIEGVKFPETVHFNAGKNVADLIIDCSGLPQQTLAEYRITVPDEYLRIYNGSHYNVLTGAFLISTWEPARKDGGKVRFIITETDGIANPNSEPQPSLYEPYESYMEVLPGANLYRVHDFLGSGAYFQFKLVKSPFPSFRKYFRLTPADGYWDTTEQYLNNESWYHSWLLLNGLEGDDEDYPTCCLKGLDGQDATLDYLGFSTYYTAYEAEYSYARTSGDNNTRTDCAASMMICTAYCTYWKPAYELPDYLFLYFEWDRSAN